MNNVFQILMNNEGFIVFAEEETRTLITWNGSTTFYWWAAPYENYLFREVDTATSPQNLDITEAHLFARDWFDEHRTGTE